MKETWKPIPGWPYEASSAGRIRRSVKVWANNVPEGRGGPNSTFAGRVLKPNIHDDGYALVALHASGKRKDLLVSVLVCTAFHGPRPSPDHEAAHWNGLRGDNRAENLRWATRPENHEDMKHQGTWMGGSANPRAKLMEADVRAIRATYVARSKMARAMGRKRLPKGAVKALCERFEITRDQLYDIVRRVSWKHI